MSLSDCLSADYTAAYFLTEDWGEECTFHNQAGTITAATTSIWGDVEFSEVSYGVVADTVTIEIPGASLPVDPVREDTITRAADSLVWTIERVAKEREQWRLDLQRKVRPAP